MIKAATLLLLLVVPTAAGCSTRRGGHDSGSSRVGARRLVADDVARRTGIDLPSGILGGHRTAARPGLPTGVLSEQQAIERALDRNAFFLEQLADLDIAGADVVQAGVIANPDLQVLFPLGPKQAEATLTAPLESLWLRGRRLAAARAASDRSVARLVQVGLDLVRDVRLAYADLGLARRRLALMTEAADLRDRVAELAAARVRAGEAAPLDSVTSRTDAIRARQDAARLVHDANIAEERLRALLGAGADRAPIALATDAPSDVAGGDNAWADDDVDRLVARALDDRADARAAGLAVAAAHDRARLARSEIFIFSGIVDYNQRGGDGAEAGPGIKLAIPLFNQNQGGIARADGELERARRQLDTLRDRIILDVREAHTRVAQARQDLLAWRGQIGPALREAVDLSERAYRAGETPLVQVLDASRQLLDGQIREAQTEADLRRARADLERGVGRRLDLAPPSARPVEGHP